MYDPIDLRAKLLERDLDQPVRVPGQDRGKSSKQFPFRTSMSLSLAFLAGWLAAAIV